MATYRQVQTNYWQKGFILSLTPEEKYFYIYLMTNSKTTQCGIYELPKRVIEMETGYNRETVDKLLDRFVNYKKILYNDETQEIMIINWMKHNKINSSAVKSCITKELSEVKHDEFIKMFYMICDNLDYELDTVIRPSVDGVDTVSGDSGEEKEEEKEEEQKKKNNKKTLPPQFEKFWSLYPRKVRKQDAVKTWKKAVKDGCDPEEVIKAAVSYSNECKRKGTSPDYIMHPPTFLNKERWMDYIGGEDDATSNARDDPGDDRGKWDIFVRG